MAPKPTFASVTEQSCSCNYLQNSADDPSIPITFDDQSSEYQFTFHEPSTGGDAYMVIYHCPFCGGAAPESKRALLFAVVPPEEEARLADLLSPITTIDDAIRHFGLPDLDSFVTSRLPEQDGEAPTIKRNRHLQYSKLSDVAEVSITERDDGRVFSSLHGKYVGSQK